MPASVAICKPGGKTPAGHELVAFSVWSARTLVARASLPPADETFYGHNDFSKIDILFSVTYRPSTKNRQIHVPGYGRGKN
jgi:hypothetical protein